jgi:hypothetical protein
MLAMFNTARLVRAADDKVTGRPDPASPEWEAYFSVTP